MGVAHDVSTKITTSDSLLLDISHVFKIGDCVGYVVGSIYHAFNSVHLSLVCLPSLVNLESGFLMFCTKNHGSRPSKTSLDHRLVGNDTGMNNMVELQLIKNMMQLAMVGN